MPNGERDPNNHGHPEPGSASVEEIEGFADRFEAQWHSAVGSQPDASALDPELWQRIRNDAKPRKKRRHGPRRKASLVASAGNQLSGEAHQVPNVLPSVPSSQWHRGALVFFMVALIGCIVMFTPGRSVDPQFGAIVREAPQAMTPVPGQELGCNVEPLTRDEVFEIVIDPTLFGVVNTRELFAIPPPSPWTYPHTETWLPETNGTVEMADGPRPVRLPTAKEFQGAQAALNRYLRCQVEGTNFQLWALESPAEVQRQIMMLIADDNDWVYVNSWMPEEITETQIFDIIDRIGPEPRVNGLQYMIIAGPGNELVQANPDTAAAYVADNPETDEVEYAWIATQWVDPETGEVLSTRGAGLEATPAMRKDGYIDNLVVMILKYDNESGAWLVEWLVPTI